MPKLRDEADWEGVQIISCGVGAQKNVAAVFRGFQYANESEARLAEMLWRMDVPFTPNVAFLLDAVSEDGRKLKRKFVPDFVFDGLAFVWRQGATAQLVHGLEAKGAPPHVFPPKAVENVRLLREQRGISIKLVNNIDIERFFSQNKRLPLWPYCRPK